MNFVNNYLPMANITDNTIKKAIFISQLKKKRVIYRLNYLYFPLISELDLIYSEYEMVYNFISCYRFQLDINMKLVNSRKDSGEFLVRLYRLPCQLKIKGIQL